MLFFILQRILSTLPVMGLVALMVFLLLRISGDPAAILAQEDFSFLSAILKRLAKHVDDLRAQGGSAFGVFDHLANRIKLTGKRHDIDDLVELKVGLRHLGGSVPVICGSITSFRGA